MYCWVFLVLFGCAFASLNGSVGPCSKIYIKAENTFFETTKKLENLHNEYNLLQKETDSLGKKIANYDNYINQRKALLVSTEEIQLYRDIAKKVSYYLNGDEIMPLTVMYLGNFQEIETNLNHFCCACELNCKFNGFFVEITKLDR